MKKILALLLVSMLLLQVATAEPINVAKSGFFQSDKSFSANDLVVVSSMDFGQTSLGYLSVDATVLKEAKYENTPALIVKQNTSASFSYIGIKAMDARSTPDTFWHIVAEGTSKIDNIIIF